jgi:N-acetylglucosaminyldiphosphoundecaprenol N-acetyl-beta-D-mannosaminyltransferase
LNYKETILGIDISTLSLEKIIRTVYDFIERGEKQKVIVTANPHALVLALEDDVFYNSIKNADICLPDGTGVVLASRFFGGAINKRIAGPDFFVQFTDYVNKKGNQLRYFFFGSTEETLKKIQNNIEKSYPNIVISGTYAPPFGDWSEEENKKSLDLINQSGAHVLWVGLGAPKQEKWIERNKDRLNVNVIVAVGAAFDFFAGTKKRSSKMFRDAGLEWLPRFLREPGRLWRRNIVSTPKFLFLILKEKLRRH